MLATAQVTTHLSIRAARVPGTADRTGPVDLPRRGLAVAANLTGGAVRPRDLAGTILLATSGDVRAAGGGITLAPGTVSSSGPPGPACLLGWPAVRSGQTRSCLVQKVGGPVEGGGVFLWVRGADPLGKTGAVVPAGVPRARAHRDLAVKTVAVEVVVDEAGPDAVASVVPYPLQQVLVEEVAEAGFRRGVAEPAAVLPIGAGGHKGREVAVSGPLGHLVNEPAGLHPCLLGVGELPVPYNDDDFFAREPCDMRAVAKRGDM